MAKIDWRKVKVIHEMPDNAVQLHLYDYSDVLRPRGHMKKESIAEYVLEKLISCHESWTDPKYGDNPDESTLINFLRQNMKEEMDGAWNEFINRAVYKVNPADRL